MQISFIGAGNVAWHLTSILEKTGNQIVEVYSRNIENAQKLVAKLHNASIKNDLDFSNSQAELFIIAVNDDVIQTIATAIKLPPQAILVHTSGSVGMDILAIKEIIGVFYPLQTFSKEKIVDFKEIPFCIEANNSNTEEKLIKLAQTISNQVFSVNSSQRQVLHIAAVFACNFTNHLFTLAQDILAKENLNFNLLKPLIEETVQKALQTNPLTAQTGPAKRQDYQILAKHLDFLSNEPDKQHIYQILSQSIVALYQNFPK